MEADLCDINHLDADVLLPPRKRLLAGLKKQNINSNSNTEFTSTPSSEFDSRLNNLLRSHLSNPNFSVEEIVETSRLEAEAAVKVAIAARAEAKEKAALAAKAMAAAKSALEMIEIIDEERNCRDINSMKKNNMLKKQIPVQMLYNKRNYKTDEELALKLHQAINSSPRISKNCTSSDLKSRKNKRLKRSSSLSAKTMVSNGNGEVESESSNREGYSVEENSSTFNKDERLDRRIGKEKVEENGDSLEDTDNVGRKRGRMKQKKLSLSICSIRDQTIPKEESTTKASTSKNPLIERSTMWNCQDFKASNCIKQIKIMQL